MLKITTPCFVEGGWISDYNAGFGEDQSPEFHIEGIDAKAETIHIEQGIAYGKHCYRGKIPRSTGIMSMCSHFILLIAN